MKSRHFRSHTHCFQPDDTFAFRVEGSRVGSSSVTNNPVYHFFYTPGNAGPLILRMTMAVVFFYHATQKAFGWFGGSGWMSTIETWTSVTGLGLPAVIAPLVMVSELAICATLFFGFLTRLASLGAVIILSGAIFHIAKHSPSFGDLELPLILWAAGVALFCLGGGAISLDRGISKNILPSVG